MNNITIEFCPEDRARIDRLIAALEHKACDLCVSTALDVMRQKYETPAAPVAKEAPAETAQEHPVDASQDLPWDTEAPAKVETPAEPEKPTEPVKEAVVPPLSDLQNVIVELVHKGKREQAHEIIKSYGVARASDVPDDKRAELLDKLNELKKQGG
jgi:hypothetical protein